MLTYADVSSGQPCVSLYVRDPEVMSRSSFLDVWLDNVIASVPHVLMCWHKDTVIQGYMLKRTQAYTYCIYTHTHIQGYTLKRTQAYTYCIHTHTHTYKATC
jgi:hypothetical protein